MARKRAAGRYAKALFSLAQEKEELKSIDRDIRLISNTIKDSRELQNLLKSPIIKNDLKRSSLKAIFTKVESDTSHLFDVLIANERISLLPEVTGAFIQLVDKKNKVTTAEVITAIPITEELEEKVSAKVTELTGKEATLVKKVNKDLIGGFILRINDMQYDASVSGKLNKLKYNFKQN